MISAGKAKTMFNVHKHAHSRTLILNMRIPQPYRRLWPVPGLEGGSRSSRTHRGQRAAGSGQRAQPASWSVHIISSQAVAGERGSRQNRSRRPSRRHATSRVATPPLAARAKIQTDRPNDHVGPGPGPRPPPLPPAAVWRRRRGVLSNPSQASPSACGVWSGCVREHPNRTVGFSQRQNVGMSRVRVYVYHY